ncbi:BQ2448_3421 [Microbotryum intermedium]|uniref:BQ2448_3421 protein n=1 Tax=Microbotryum intermedium TaxID=269621 RepID=A0A238FD11_9BASI|nr:BQ2448_3421 [Microbotryum intermedium]
MKRAKLFNIVTGVKIRPLLDFASQDDIDKWDERDQWCQENILNTIDITLQGALAYTETSAEMWTILENKFRKRGHNVLYTGLIRLLATKYIEGQDMDAHLTKLRMCYEELAKIGKAISDEYLCIFILNSLPESWSNVNMWFEQAHANPDDVVTSTQVIGQIKNEAQRRQTAAISVNSNQVITKSNAGALATLQPLKCTHCNKKGHIAADCYKNPNNPNNRLDKSKGSPKLKTNKAAVVSEPISFSVQVANSVTTRVMRWIIGSGAAHHHTGDRSSIIDFVAHPLSVETASGQRVVCPGYSTVILEATSGQTIHLKNIYHLPGATTGLISVRVITLLGFKVAFGINGLCKVSKGNTVVVSTCPDTAYELDIKMIKGVSVTRSTVSAPLMTWHRCLGHLPVCAILDMVRIGAAEELDLSDKTVHDCDTCLYAKSERSSFKGHGSASAVLERVSIDLGFVQEPNHAGCTVYLAIVDQFSCGKWCFSLSSKTSIKVLKTFNTFRLSAEKMTGNSIRFVRSNNGGEFTSKAFIDYFKSHGITHKCTAPYTPENNGQVERLNGSLMNTVKAMLHDSKLPHSLWLLAMTKATYIHNCTGVTRLGGKTPFEIIHGKKPQIGHLKPFGAIAFVHIDKTLRKKLDDKVKQGILVGYLDYNYIVWFEDTETTTVTRHCSFGCKELDKLELANNSDEDTDEYTPLSPVPHTLAQVPEVEEQPSRPGTPEGYRCVQVGRNPGRFEEIIPENILNSRLHPRAAHFIGPASTCDIICYGVFEVPDNEPVVDEIWGGESLCLAIKTQGSVIPTSFEEAISLPEAEHWIGAINLELASLNAHQVFKVVVLPCGARALGSKWVFTLKKDAAGRIVRYKARLVAQGFAQHLGIDFTETFAPVARMSTIRFLIALATAHGLKLKQFDFDTTFLNGKMTDDVYMKAPKGWSLQPGQCLKLIASMYGTKQAPCEWNTTLDRYIIVTFYVDNGLVAATSQELIKTKIGQLQAVFQLKRQGAVSLFLSLEVLCKEQYCLLHQSRYIKDILKHFGFDLVKTKATPMLNKEDRTVDTSATLDDLHMYQSMVGALQYAAQMTRPDIAAAVCAVTQRLATPTENDLLAVKRIFHYLAGTIDFGLCYQLNASTDLVIYSDASWASDFSKQQSLVATSTTESEILAASMATKEAVWLRQVATNLYVPQQLATIIHEDNQATIKIANNPAHHVRTKHFSVVHHFVREGVGFGEVKLVYCDTDSMVADTLTKGLGCTKFERHRQSMGMVQLSNIGTRGSVNDKSLH